MQSNEYSCPYAAVFYICEFRHDIESRILVYTDISFIKSVSVVARIYIVTPDNRSWKIAANIISQNSFLSDKCGLSLVRKTNNTIQDQSLINSPSIETKAIIVVQQP